MILKMISRFAATVVVLFSSSTVAMAQVAERTWTSGTHSVKAQLVEANADVAKLKRSDNGKVIEVPISKLSKEDQQAIKQFLDSRSAKKESTPTKSELKKLDENSVNWNPFGTLPVKLSWSEIDQITRADVNHETELEWKLDTETPIPTVTAICIQKDGVTEDFLVQVHSGKTTEEKLALIQEADDKYKKLVSTEKVIVLESNGQNLTVANLPQKAYVLIGTRSSMGAVIAWSDFGDRFVVVSTIVKDKKALGSGQQSSSDRAFALGLKLLQSIKSSSDWSPLEKPVPEEIRSDFLAMMKKVEKLAEEKKYATAFRMMGQIISDSMDEDDSRLGKGINEILDFVPRIEWERVKYDPAEKTLKLAIPGVPSKPVFQKVDEAWHRKKGN